MGTSSAFGGLGLATGDAGLVPATASGGTVVAEEGETEAGLEGRAMAWTLSELVLIVTAGGAVAAAGVSAGLAGLTIAGTLSALLPIAIGACCCVFCRAESSTEAILTIETAPPCDERAAV